MFTFNLTIPRSHPCIRGHFPNNPIVPAVVTIEHILQGIKDQKPHSSIHEINYMKFIKPLKPDEVAQVSVVEKDKNLFQVTLEVNKVLYLKGAFQLDSRESH